MRDCWSMESPTGKSRQVTESFLSGGNILRSANAVEVGRSIQESTSGEFACLKLKQMLALQQGTSRFGHILLRVDNIMVNL